MIIYKVNKELAVDIGVTTFTLHPGDHFEFNGECIERLHYATKIPWRDNTTNSGTLELVKEKLSMRLANNTPRGLLTLIKIVDDGLSVSNSAGSWVPIFRCVGKEIEDVTIQWHRDKILNQLV